MSPFLADFLMILHFLWAAFMVVGLPLGLIIRSPVLRWGHFMGMTITALLAFSGAYCPLTVWEEALRQGSDPGFTYGGSFIARHLGPVLYPRLDPMLIRGASVFWGGLTVAAMLAVRPGRRARGRLNDRTTERRNDWTTRGQDEGTTGRRNDKMTKR